MLTIEPREPTTFVTIVVGTLPNVEEFMVHKEVACFHSPVLDAAFNSRFIEGQTYRYILEDTTPRAVRLLVQWLYSKNLELVQLRGYPSKQAIVDAESAQSEDMALAELWVLADKLCIPALGNLVLDKIFLISKHQNTLAVPTYYYIFENTSETSGLRRYTIDFCFYYLLGSSLEEWESYFPRELLLALAVNFAKERDLENGCVIPKRLVPARYHNLEDTASFVTTPRGRSTSDALLLPQFTMITR